MAVQMLLGLFPKSSKGGIVGLESLPDLLNDAQPVKEIRYHHRSGAVARDNVKAGGAPAKRG